MTWLAVALGGALGAMGRYGVTLYTFPILANRFPLATFSVNIVGSLLIGICYVLIIEKGVIAPELRNWLMAGFLGAFTTFSTFALDAVTLWQNGHAQLAAIYVVASVAACIAAVAAGIHCTLRLL
ncbi:MAG: fluoride efflux transporter CrcB [Cellvibrionaceae bacterium]|nr:fluoride efflux transporter CrcB [Cellvibrionaceae bacterium]|tara:strand:+ start:12925 stop:13299 length:375 start_codon:yes stop_codon:yes gene_type:complete